MDTRLNMMHCQHEVLKDSLSLVELVAMLIIGGIGMTVSLFGIEANDLIAYGLGIGIMAVIFGYGLVELIMAIRNFIWENQDRLKSKDK